MRHFPVLASILIHVGLVYALSPGHRDEHTIQWFEGSLELGEKGDGHSERTHFHQPKKAKKKEDDDAPASVQEPVLAAGAAEATNGSPVDIPESGSVGSGSAPLTPLQRYLLELIGRINAVKRYPRDSLLNEEEGTVVVTLVISPEGRIQSSELTRPSPFKSLNRASLEAVQQLGGLPPLPDTQGPVARPIRVRIPMAYHIAH